MRPFLPWYFAVALALSATRANATDETWQSALARMPLTPGVSEINRTNFAAVMLPAFKSNQVVKALILMPGSTDEFYFFRRAHAKLNVKSPTLLDAVVAITNQTHVRVLFRPPMLLLHTTEDPLEPIAAVKHQESADKLKAARFLPHAKFDDQGWEVLQPILTKALRANFYPAHDSPDSWHFFRHSFAAYDLNGWEALEVVSLAGKTRFTVSKTFLSGRPKVVFEGDTRFGPPPPFN
ncbi:MAG: hypothetical protein AB1705_21275 [Verrucomicrobiota bacterium]